MDRLFLTGLSGKDGKRTSIASDRLEGSSIYTSSSLYCTGAAAPGSLPSPTASALPGFGALVGTPYGGRPYEQLLYDAMTCDLVLLVADDVCYARAVPVHKEVLRSRNPGGYFCRLLADPDSFVEYSDRASGAGAVEAAGPLASKPMIRRMHWPWPLAAALLSFLYRDNCEVAWEQLVPLRQLGEEVGLKSLLDAVDCLLDPQHLLPWTVADLRAAAVQLRRHQLVEAADRYAAAMKAAGMDEATRMAMVVYHARQNAPKFAMPSSLGPQTSGRASASSLPAIDFGAASGSNGSGAGGGGNSELLNARGGSFSRAALTAVSGAVSGESFRSRYNTHCDTSGGDGVFSSSFNVRDNRVGIDMIEGVLRSVALDTRLLRGLLLPGQRRDQVVLYGVGGADGGVSGGGGTATTAWGGGGSRPPSSGSWPRVAPLALAAGCGGALRPSSPYGGASTNGTPQGPLSPVSPQQQQQHSPCDSLELPRLGNRIKAAFGLGGGGGVLSFRSKTGSGSGAGPGAAGAGGGAGAVSMRPDLRNGRSSSNLGAAGPWSASVSGGGSGLDPAVAEAPSELGDQLDLVVIVPAVHLAPSLAVLVSRPLDVHQPGGMGTVLVSAGGAAGAGAAAGGKKDPATSFDPFSRLAGVPGMSWGGDKSAPHAGGTGYGGCTSGLSLLQLLPATSTLGNFDQLTLALALDVAPGAAGGGGIPSAGTSPLDVLGANAFAAIAAASSANGSTAATISAQVSRLLTNVLSTVSAMDIAQFVVRMDANAVAQAVAFERRRAVVDVVSSLNGIAGVLGGGGGGGGSGGSITAGGGSTANVAKTILGPANPREFHIPLPSNPTGAIAITQPVGLVLVDTALIEAVTGPSSADSFHASGSAPTCSSTGYYTAAAGVTAPGTSGATLGGGGGGGSMRVASLWPHVMASASMVSQMITAVGIVSQVLRVAGDQLQQQRGSSGSPPLRASLRIVNPSQAMLAVLSQTNTHFAVEPNASTICVRKAPGDIVRLLQALQSTLPPVRQPSGSAATSYATGGGDAALAAAIRGRLSTGESFSFSSASRQVSMVRGRNSLDTVRQTTGSGSVSGGASSLSAAPSMRRRTSLDHLQRTSTTNGHGGPAAPYSGGVPYSQLERLFPGGHLHVVELSSPGFLVGEF